MLVDVKHVPSELIDKTSHDGLQSVFVPNNHSKPTSLSPSPSPCIPRHSKSRPVDDLVVNHQLPTTVVDDHGSNAASAVCKSGIDLGVEPTLVDNPETLLDITSLGHADDSAVRTHVENAVLLVDRAEHALHIDAGLWVAHEGALFLELTSKEIDTQISVLTRLRRGRDAYDLARASLKDDKVADADELARDRDTVGREAATRLNEADLLADTLSDTAWTPFFIFDDHLLTVMAVMVERVRDMVGSTLEATAEGVVFALVVVITHVVAAARLLDFDVFFFDSSFFGRATTVVLDVVGGVDATAVVALSDVKLGLESLVSYLSAIDVDVVFSILSATRAFDVDVNLGILVLDWLPVASAAISRWFFIDASKLLERSKHKFSNRHLHRAKGMSRDAIHTVLDGALLLDNDHAPRRLGCPLHDEVGERC